MLLHHHHSIRTHGGFDIVAVTAYRQASNFLAVSMSPANLVSLVAAEIETSPFIRAPGAKEVVNAADPSCVAVVITSPDVSEATGDAVAVSIGVTVGVTVAITVAVGVTVAVLLLTGVGVTVILAVGVARTVRFLVLACVRSGCGCLHFPRLTGYIPSFRRAIVGTVGLVLAGGMRTQGSEAITVFVGVTLLCAVPTRRRCCAIASWSDSTTVLLVTWFLVGNIDQKKLLYVNRSNDILIHKKRKVRTALPIFRLFSLCFWFHNAINVSNTSLSLMQGYPNVPVEACLACAAWRALRGPVEACLACAASWGWTGLTLNGMLTGHPAHARHASTGPRARRLNSPVLNAFPLDRFGFHQSTEPQ